jgi:hypothetical protein
MPVCPPVPQNTRPDFQFSETLSRLRLIYYRILLTPWSRVPIEKLTASQPVKKVPAFCEIRRFVTKFTRARHLSLS